MPVFAGRRPLAALWPAVPAAARRSGLTGCATPRRRGRDSQDAFSALTEETPDAGPLSLYGRRRRKHRGVLSGSAAAEPLRWFVLPLRRSQRDVPAGLLSQHAQLPGCCLGLWGPLAVSSHSEHNLLGGTVAANEPARCRLRCDPTDASLRWQRWRSERTALVSGRRLPLLVVKRSSLREATRLARSAAAHPLDEIAAAAAVSVAALSKRLRSLPARGDCAQTLAA